MQGKAQILAKMEEPKHLVATSVLAQAELTALAELLNQRTGSQVREEDG